MHFCNIFQEIGYLHEKTVNYKLQYIINSQNISYKNVFLSKSNIGIFPTFLFEL